MGNERGFTPCLMCVWMCVCVCMSHSLDEQHLGSLYLRYNTSANIALFFLTDFFISTKETNDDALMVFSPAPPSSVHLLFSSRLFTWAHAWSCSHSLLPRRVHGPESAIFTALWDKLNQLVSISVVPNPGMYLVLTSDSTVFSHFPFLLSGKPKTCFWRSSKLSSNAVMLHHVFGW